MEEDGKRDKSKYISGPCLEGLMGIMTIISQRYSDQFCHCLCEMGMCIKEKMFCYVQEDEGVNDLVWLSATSSLTFPAWTDLKYVISHDCEYM